MKEDSSPDVRRGDLRADCANCFGLCCVALYFSASDGFPVDKEAGLPCLNLQSDFRCKVYRDLSRTGLKGCTAYDCFGAGQKVSQFTFAGRDWRQAPEAAAQMFRAFLTMRQLQEMLWYLGEAVALPTDCGLRDKLQAMLAETKRLTLLGADSLLGLDVAAHRAAVNALLLQTSKVIRNKVSSHHQTPGPRQRNPGRRLDLIGKDLRSRSLRGQDLSGAYLIAADLRGVDLTGADLIGADLRDADLRGADLAGSLFLTQAQINSARGDSDTRLPRSLTRPLHWQIPVEH